MTTEAMTHSYRITRTRLVTEVFRVDAESEDEAFDVLGNGDEGSDFEKIEENTLQSESEIAQVD